MSLQRRIRALEGRLPSHRFLDMSHLTDQQLELIETCVGPDGQWDRDRIASLTNAQSDQLLLALRSLGGTAYAQLRKVCGIALSADAEARIADLRAS